MKLDTTRLENILATCSGQGRRLPRLVVLSACVSKGVGEVFSRAGVQHVVATTDRVPDAVALEFELEFYSTLVRADSVGGAFSWALSQLAPEHRRLFTLLPERSAHAEPIFSSISTRPRAAPRALPLVGGRSMMRPRLFVRRQGELQMALEQLRRRRLLYLSGEIGQRGVGTTAFLGALGHHCERRNIYEVIYVDVNASSNPAKRHVRYALRRQLSRTHGSIKLREEIRRQQALKNHERVAAGLTGAAAPEAGALPLWHDHDDDFTDASTEYSYSTSIIRPGAGHPRDASGAPQHAPALVRKSTVISSMRFTTCPEQCLFMFLNSPAVHRPTVTAAAAAAAAGPCTNLTRACRRRSGPHRCCW